MTKSASYDRDEDLIEAVRADSRPRVRVALHDKVEVVLGRSSDPETELHLDAIRQDCVTVSRRRGGGCPVVLDPGNAIVSVVLPLPGITGITQAFEGISAHVIDALGRLGIPGVEMQGTSDLVLGDRKIGGSCIYRALGLLYYATTLLIDPDIDLVERYLRHPPREPAYRQGRTHRDFMGSLSAVTGSKDVEALVVGLVDLLDAEQILSAVARCPDASSST